MFQLTMRMKTFWSHPPVGFVLSELDRITHVWLLLSFLPTLYWSFYSPFQKNYMLLRHHFICLSLSSLGTLFPKPHKKFSDSVNFTSLTEFAHIETISLCKTRTKDICILCIEFPITRIYQYEHIIDLLKNVFVCVFLLWTFLKYLFEQLQSERKGQKKSFYCFTPQLAAIKG